MKKMMFAAVFSVSLLLPCWLTAQEAETDNEEETAEAPETPQKGKKGKPAKAEKTDKAGETAETAKAGQGDAVAKDQDLAKQQKRIEKLQAMLKKAKKNSERKRYEDALKIEQHKLQTILKKKTDPLKIEIQRTQEQLSLCGPETKARLKKKLADTEERIKALEDEANLEKWCVKYEPAAPKNGPAPDPGSGKKSRRNKRKKK